MTLFQSRLAHLRAAHEALIAQSNVIDPDWYNGVFERYRFPVVTAAHVPLEWRYDLNPWTNPDLIERLGVNAVFNAGAIGFTAKILVVCRVEGSDQNRPCAESLNDRSLPVLDELIVMPETAERDNNVYDMRPSNTKMAGFMASLHGAQDPAARRLSSAGAGRPARTMIQT
jgi:4-O-beta-D-mannosyl-D-glucose phosphorylase